MTIITETFNRNLRKLSEVLENYEPRTYQALVELIATHGLYPWINSVYCVSNGTSERKTITCIFYESRKADAKQYYCLISWDSDESVDLLQSILSKKDKRERLELFMSLAHNIVSAIEPMKKKVM